MKIVFTGGGSGGHIFPIIAIIRQIKKIYKGKEEIKIYYLGPKEGHGVELLKKEGVKIRIILSGKIRRYFSLKNLLDLFKMPIGLIQSFFWLFVIAPDLIFSKSGYGSFLVALNGTFLGIPLFLHESDAVAGVASKIEGKWALQIFTSFPEKQNSPFPAIGLPKDKIINVGNPIRESILGGNKEKARKMFGIKEGRKVVLILGGSQGSMRINETILDILPDILAEFDLIHQTGDRNFKEIKSEAEAVLFEGGKKEHYHIYPFLDEFLMKNALAAADLVVSRAGSGTLFELAAYGKPAILIPLSSSAQSHQLKNAYIFADNGGGEVIEEKNLKPHFLLEKIKYYLKREDILPEMAEASRKFARLRAAEVIASYILEYLKKSY